MADARAVRSFGDRPLIVLTAMAPFTPAQLKTLGMTPAADGGQPRHHRHNRSGAAGPAGSPYGDMPGHVCLAAVGDTATVSRTIENGGTDRPRNMNLFARQLLALFEETLRAQPEEAPPA
eukprot:gene65948-biopygen48358